ncbi:FAD-dependent oxidoreductase [Actinotalea sp. Marseille-Q4924]|uniref:FAD-dependent oxidoreductase n=1 Tax=Actinotalea sp. Marseille-Q4924 TaxID=2866571 RepID=UPI001CE43430|nr:FAD-dependent oxidoreductase [Actinotalea sp. Marseille-Q4924]
MAARVVVVGGGYGGSAVARQLDDVADVVLVEPRDGFVHTVGALRAAADAAWEDRVFRPYDGLLKRGRVLQDWVRSVSPGVVLLSTTQRLEADFVVLATGTSYAFPAKTGDLTRDGAVAALARMRDDLSRCDAVLVEGGGPVGLELAGELTHAFEDLHVVVVEREDRVLPGEDVEPELRESVVRQLTDRGVELVTGAALVAPPPYEVGRYGPFVAETAAGVSIGAQMWFRCHGARPLTDYLDDDLVALRRRDRTVRVTRHLSLVGEDRLFAVGDITDMPEDKRATVAHEHAGVVVQNIRDLMAGHPPSAAHRPARRRLVLALGPDAGAAQVEQADGSVVVLGARDTVRLKEDDLTRTDLPAPVALVGVPPQPKRPTA